jgi:hypothetical protein
MRIGLNIVSQTEQISMGSSRESIERIPGIVSSLYSVVDELERLFPGRHFTPDGHLVGSLGEVWAAYLYGIDLASASAEGHDGQASDGRHVQIKATQVGSVGLRSSPDHLLVLQLNRADYPVEIYNGPGAAPWHAAGKPQKNGQRSIGLAKLRELMKLVPEDQRLSRKAG